VIFRLLRERYGRQVRRSPYPHAATAIGLAIAADSKAGYRLRERFTRHFGVWRESDDGRSVSFDTLFAKETPLPTAGEDPLVRKRHYRPTHNIGHFRYLECSRLNLHGQPQGDIATWDEIHFPFDPQLQTAIEPAELAEKNLRSIPIERGYHFQNVIEETYSCDAHGLLEVEIADLTTGYRRRCRLRSR
jgi:molecular chaperone DnaK (HSP70)